MLFLSSSLSHSFYYYFSEVMHCTYNYSLTLFETKLSQRQQTHGREILLMSLSSCISHCLLIHYTKHTNILLEKTIYNTNIRNFHLVYFQVLLLQIFMWFQTFDTPLIQLWRKEYLNNLLKERKTEQTIKVIQFKFVIILHKMSKDTIFLSLSQKTSEIKFLWAKMKYNIFWVHNSKEKFSSKHILEVIFFEVFYPPLVRKAVHANKHYDIFS